MKSTLILVLFASLISRASAQSLDSLFTQTFKSNYVASECYSNIKRLLILADKNGININRANVLHITNKGFSVFGMINAEYARGNFAPKEQNWEFHAILEQDGLIYDYDFGMQPVVTKTKDYFEKMFLVESKAGRFEVGREKKMSDYEISILPGVEVVRTGRGSPKGTAMKLGEYLSRL